MLIGKEYTIAKYNTVPTIYPCRTFWTSVCRETGQARQRSMLSVTEWLAQAHAVTCNKLPAGPIHKAKWTGHVQIVMPAWHLPCILLKTTFKGCLQVCL